jgi:HAD superfamily hydrolase (TIGR01509 family)
MSAARREPGPLVIFDCDGVLVDSERLAFATLCESLGEVGIVLDADTTLERYLGRRDADITAEISAQARCALPTDFDARYEARLFDALRRELRPIAGVREVLAGSALPRCVASSSRLERIRLSLQAAGLAPFFAARSVFSACGVPRGKPAPDLFLHAAARMSHDPARCVVVEDSTAGVQAGRAAGMRVLAFAGGGHVDGATYGVALRAAGAHTVFHAMAALPALLAAWEAGP